MARQSASLSTTGFPRLRGPLFLSMFMDLLSELLLTYIAQKFYACIDDLSATPSQASCNLANVYPVHGQQQGGSAWQSYGLQEVPVAHQ